MKAWGVALYILTLAAEKGGEVPELGHVEGLKDLALVGGTVTVENDGGVLVLVVLVGKRQASTDRDLGANDTVAAVEALGEHVHGATLAVGDALTAAQKLADDGADGAATHQGEAVAAVGSDDVVLLGESVLNAGGDGLLAGGQVAETTNLLFLVQTVGGHFHLPGGVQVSLSSRMGAHRRIGRWQCMHRFVVGACLVSFIPDADHVVVHLLQLLLGHLDGVGRGVKLVGLEALVREVDEEVLILGLFDRETMLAFLSCSIGVFLVSSTPC